ncbi:MAG: hypothetical protein OXT09_15795 [Myxococcales bacterium]|nr:hypothetical protein [Myxococcales bacterium]
MAARRFTLASAVVALILGLASPALAGPWTRDPGRFYAKLSEGLYLANSFVDASGTLQEGVSYTGLTTALYGELGLIERFHVQLYVPYVLAISTDSDDASFTRGGMGDGILGVQYGLPIEAMPVAVRATLKMPLYARDSSLSERAFPVAGDGQIDSTLWLSAGTSLDAIAGWTYLEVGYQLRTEEYIGDDPLSERSYADTIRSTAQLGYGPGELVMLALTLDLALPLEDDSFTKAYFNGGLGAFFKWDKDSPWSIEANLDRTLWARNSSLGTAIGLGLSYQH